MLHNLLKTASENNSRNALFCNGKFYTYKELYDTAFGIENYLKKLGIERIGIYTDNNFYTYAAILGVVLANKTFVSKIVFVDPVINPTTRTASVRATINNYNKALKPEMFLEGIVNNVKSNKESVIVPKSAVLWTGERSVVYIKLPNLSTPSFEFREVTLGESNGANYTVLNGLSNGDEVVTNGAFVIDASAQLNNQSSMMNRNLLTSKFQGLPDFTLTTPVEFKNQLKLDNFVWINFCLKQSKN